MTQHFLQGHGDVVEVMCQGHIDAVMAVCLHILGCFNVFGGG